METGQGAGVVAPFEGQSDAPLVEAAEFEAAFGEPIAQALDLETWKPGEDLLALYARTAREVEDAVRQEDEIRKRIRDVVFSRLRERTGAPAEAGVYQATMDEIEKVHRGLLFNGGVEACDGTSIPHDTLPLTIVQIGVCLVSYSGDQGSWVQRLYRRDLRVGGTDPVEQTLEVLERRRRRAAFDVNSSRDNLSELAQRGIMTYAERAVLLQRSHALWRMGHGNPAPYELLTGSGMPELLSRSLDILNQLILEHKRFVFVPSAPPRWLLTIGNALNPLEYAVVDHVTRDMEKIAEGHYRGAWRQFLPRVHEFVAEAGPRVIIGAFKASRIAPPQLFYAHADYVHAAAHIALADSLLQEHRGFPM